MNITNRTSLVGFLVALSTLGMASSAVAANADTMQPSTQQTTTSVTQSQTQTTPPTANNAGVQDGVQGIEGRLARLSNLLRDRADQLSEADQLAGEQVAGEQVAVGFANRSGRPGGWVDTRRGGWADGRRGGSFVNVNPWRNGWSDGGGFANWRNY